MEDAKGRLLAVDDNSDSAELVARVAAKCGYEAQTISDPRALRRTVDEWKPEVLTLDLCMPEADGIGLLSMLEESGFGGQLVIISGQEGWLRKAAGRLAVAARPARRRRDGQAGGHQGAAPAPDQSAPAPGGERSAELRAAVYPGLPVRARTASGLAYTLGTVEFRPLAQPRRASPDRSFATPDRSWASAAALDVGFVLQKSHRPALMVAGHRVYIAKSVHLSSCFGASFHLTYLDLYLFLVRGARCPRLVYGR